MLVGLFFFVIDLFSVKDRIFIQKENEEGMKRRIFLKT